MSKGHFEEPGRTFPSCTVLPIQTHGHTGPPSHRSRALAAPRNGSPRANRPPRARIGEDAWQPDLSLRLMDFPGSERGLRDDLASPAVFSSRLAARDVGACARAVRGEESCKRLRPAMLRPCKST